jgi:tetratricopeptide (TPR) repeat protein
MSSEAERKVLQLKNEVDQLRGQRKLDQAIAVARRMCDLSQALGPGSPAFAWALTCLGDLLREKGEYAQAESSLQLALEANRQIQNAHERLTPEIITSLGLLYSAQGKYSAAESLFKRAPSKSIGKLWDPTISKWPSAWTIWRIFLITWVGTEKSSHAFSRLGRSGALRPSWSRS